MRIRSESHSNAEQQKIKNCHPRLQVTNDYLHVFLEDLMAAILVFQNNEMAAMLVSQTNPVRVQFLIKYALKAKHWSPDKFKKLTALCYQVCVKNRVISRHKYKREFGQNLSTKVVSHFRNYFANLPHNEIITPG